MRRLLSTIRRPREVSRRVGLRAGGAALAVSCLASLAITTSAAQAVVVSDAGTQAGVSIVPNARGAGLPAGVSAVTSANPCTDPWLATDLGGPSMPNSGLCYRGGAVMHKNETFALTWDQDRNYWSRTRGYVEQYLRDVADASGSLGSPYAITPQYSDAGGKAQNSSIFGGGCIDYGNVGGSACEFGNAGTAGHDFPANGCSPSGDSLVFVNSVALNNRCLTDAQLKGEVSTMVTQTGMLSRTQPGYTPVVTLLLPPGVEDCLDASHNLCSTNGQLTPPPPVLTAGSAQNATVAPGTYGVEITYVTAGGETTASSAQTVTTTGTNGTITISSPPAAPGATGWYAYVTAPGGTTYMRQGNSPTAIGTDIQLTAPPTGGFLPPTVPSFCSYHSQVNVGGTEVAYVVQPWTAGTGCDERGVPNFPQDPTEQQLALGVGARLVSPLSQSHIASIVNPGFDGWVALNGSETDDNGGCAPLPRELDKVTVGSSSQNPYYLQRTFNNAGVLEFDPVTYYGCAPVNTFEPQFVAPSAVDQGDVVQFDGSSTASTLMVPSGGYSWSFGDGTTATGPSVVHSFTKGGIHTVTLTVTDRGGNKGTSTQSIVVLGAAGQSPTPPSTQPVPSHPGPSPALQVHLQLSPQGLKSMLRNGLALQVHSNKVANGILSVSITRAQAKRAHIKAGPGNTVVIARGTTASIHNGVSFLKLHLPRKVAAKLKKLRHATFTIRLSLVAAGGGHVAIVAAGRY